MKLFLLKFYLLKANADHRREWWVVAYLGDLSLPFLKCHVFYLYIIVIIIIISSSSSSRRRRRRHPREFYT